MHTETATETGRPPPRLRVLVAEDGADLRRLLALTIDAEADLRCVGTVGSHDALPALVAELQPDVLVLDLVLEDGSSLPLIGRLRAEHPRMRIVLYSGYVGSVVLGEARRRGATACVAKGTDYDYLLDAIRGFAPLD